METLNLDTERLLVLAVASCSSLVAANGRCARATRGCFVPVDNDDSDPVVVDNGLLGAGTPGAVLHDGQSAGTASLLGLQQLGKCEFARHLDHLELKLKQSATPVVGKGARKSVPIQTNQQPVNLPTLNGGTAIETLTHLHVLNLE